MASLLGCHHLPIQSSPSSPISERVLGSFSSSFTMYITVCNRKESSRIDSGKWGGDTGDRGSSGVSVW
jgi:hypothetical protein